MIDMKLLEMEVKICIKIPLFKMEIEGKILDWP